MKPLIASFSQVTFSTPVNHVATRYRGIARSQSADRGHGLQLRRVAANRLNEQSRIANSEVVLQFFVGGRGVLSSGHKLPAE